MKTLVFTIFLSLSYSILAETSSEPSRFPTEISEDYDLEKLQNWKNLANIGDREAQFRLGLYYSSIEPSAENLKQSAYWYELAAKQGHTLAQYNLGVKLIKGEGVAKNIKNALSLWLQAANADHRQSQFNLGRAYFLGIGLEENYQKAIFWFGKAADQGDLKSIELLTKINAQNKRDAEVNNNNQNSKTKTNPSSVQALSAKTQTANQNKPYHRNSLPKVLKNDENQNNIQDALNKPIDVYSGPHKHNQFIMQLPSRSGMTIIEQRNEKWLKIALEFPIPVWVHDKNLSQNSSSKDKDQMIKNKGVFARAVPKVVKGSVLGYFNQGERVMSLERNGRWHKVYPESRFPVWIKRQDWLGN